MVNSLSFDQRLTFESFGVRISLEGDDSGLLPIAFEVSKAALLGKLTLIDNPLNDLGYRFGLIFKDNRYELFQNGNRTNYGKSKSAFFKYFNSMLRIIIAENAVDKVFVHAGVVGWKGKALLFPARSFQGKTTLVAALIKRGAEYYSDEYAVIDLTGYVHAYPRDLSIREGTDEFNETEVSPSLLGAKVGNIPLNVGAVIITEYRKGCNWNPKRLTIGQGILETITHTIPIRADTEKSLSVLNKALRSAIIVQGPRGEVESAVDEILLYLDKHLN